MRRRLRGQYQGQKVARGGRLRPGDPGQSRSSRRRGRRSHGRRRRRLPDPDSGRPAARLGGGSGRRSAGAGRLRGGHVLPAPGRGHPRSGDRPVRAFHPGRGPASDRLARRAGGYRGPGRGGARNDAPDPPGDRGQRIVHPRPGRLRAQASGHPQTDPKSPGGARRPLRRAGADPVLHALLFQPHGGLQGPAAGPAGGLVLPGSHRPDHGVGAGHGPPALFHQHLPVVEAGPPLSLHRPQRRDQHGAGQRQLDERPPAHPGVGPAGPRPRQDVAADPARPVGHRLPGQRPGAAGGRGLSPGPRDDDADPRGLGGQPADVSGKERRSTNITPP